MNEKVKLADLETYVYIDASNIKNACRRSCGFDLDFVKFYGYLKRKYPRLMEVKYYEGAAIDDDKKRRYFQLLENVGYEVCVLTRRGYECLAVSREFVCKSCGALNSVQVVAASKKMKSNVDVYLASEMLERAALSRGCMNIILVSCDGDYAEAIRAIMRLSDKIRVTVLATPMTRKNNCLSARLKELNSEFGRERYGLASVENIKDLISRN